MRQFENQFLMNSFLKIQISSVTTWSKRSYMYVYIYHLRRFDILNQSISAKIPSKYKEWLVIEDCKSI